MVWVFQGLVSNGLQVCLSIAAGWVCAKFRLLDPVQLNIQLNRLAMSTCFPAFIIHLLGIKTDLQILEAWKTLGVFILWVFCVQIAVVLWCTLFERGEPWRKGLHVLLLTANNYGVVGSVLLQPTLGPVAMSVCMLTGVSMWLQMVPSAITFLEWQKWLDAKSPTSSRPVSTRKLMTSPPPNTASEREPLLLPALEVPPRPDPASSDAAATGFPHEYRYCYWTNEDYAPSQTSLKQQHKQASQTSTPTTTAAALRRRPSAPVRALAQLPGKDLTQQDIDAMLDPAAEDLGETIGPSPFADPAALSFKLATAPSSGLPTAAQLEAQLAKQRLLPSNSNASSLLQQSQAARSVHPGRISMSNTITSNRPSQHCFDQMSRLSSMGSLPPDLSGFSFSVLPASSGPSVLRQQAPLAGCMMGSALHHHHQQQQQAMMSSDAQLMLETIDAASLQTDAHASVQLLPKQGSLSSKASLHLELQLEQADLLISAEGDISHKQLIAAGQRYSCQPDDAMLQQEDSGGEEEEEGWYFGMGGGVTLQRWVQTFSHFLQTHPQLWAILSVPLKNHLLWVQVFAVILSASGLRRYLDDSTSQYVAELGWIDGVLTWFSSASVPVTLFSTGAWICGKQLISRRNIKKVIAYMAIKLLVLPCIMLGLAKMAQVDETRGMALLALCSCPVAQVAQVLAQQYGSDPETATSVSLLGTLLMVPHLVGLFKVVDTFQLFKYTMMSTR